MTGKIRIRYYYRVREDMAGPSLGLGWSVNCFPKKMLGLEQSLA